MTENETILALLALGAVLYFGKTRIEVPSIERQVMSAPAQPREPSTFLATGLNGGLATAPPPELPPNVSPFGLDMASMQSATQFMINHGY